MLVFFLKVLLVGVGLVAGTTAFTVGLYRSIHFIEEHPTKSKERITLMILSIALLHIVPLVRGFSILNISFSLFCQYMFYTLLEDYPNIETGGSTFIISFLLTLLNHFWYLRTIVLKRIGPIEILVYFLACVWATPISFFLSLTVNDEVIGKERKKRRTFASKIADRLLGLSEYNKGWEAK